MNTNPCVLCGEVSQDGWHGIYGVFECAKCFKVVEEYPGGGCITRRIVDAGWVTASQMQRWHDEIHKFTSQIQAAHDLMDQNTKPAESIQTNGDQSIPDESDR